MSLENNDQQKLENEALKQQIADLEYEIKYRKENSTMTGEVFNIPLPSHLYEFILEEAKAAGVHAGEHISNIIMRVIDEITPFREAFSLKDDSELSRARSELLEYLEARCETQTLYSLMARAEIFPVEHNQLNEHNEKSYQNTIGLLLELMTTPRAQGGQSPFPSETDIIARISDKVIRGQGKTKLQERFRDAKITLANSRK